MIVFLLAAFSCLSNAVNSAYSENSVTYDSLPVVEKVCLHIDRDYYFPGDDIWFKAYLIEASDRQLSGFSSNLHVELISPASEIIDSRIVKMDGGLGHGDFHLNENLQSGQYLIRGYTNYMRNFGDQFFFSKVITVVTSKAIAEELPDSIEYINNKIEISFFPEGGSLVENVTSVIAFKAVNALGAGCDVSGGIYTSEGLLVKTFKSEYRGMGTFYLKPVPGSEYYAIVKDRYGNEVRSEIPRRFPEGVTFSISRNGSDELVATVRTNVQTLPRVLNNELSLTVSARGITLKSINFRLKTLNTGFIIPVDELPDGIVMLTLSGINDLPLCERLVYIQNSEDIILNLDPDKTVYKQRASVSLKISLSENSGFGEEAYLSLSAAEKNSAKGSSLFPSTISSWFLLESDVRGPVEEPSYYFDPSNPKRLEDLDLLLLTQGWRDFKWKYNNLKYTPENGFTVSGRVRKLFADVPQENATVNIAILKSGNASINTATTDSSGKFQLDKIELTGEARLIASAVGKKEKLQGWMLMDSVRYSPSEIPDNISQTKVLINDNQLYKENLSAVINEADIKNTIRKRYKITDTVYLDEVKITEKRPEDPQPFYVESSRLLYGVPDAELIITPQLQHYNDITQLMAGRISGVYYDNKSDTEDCGLRISGSGGPPLFVLDGLVVSYDMISSLPVSWIDRIDVLKYAKASAFGVRGANGVISVITRRGPPLDTDIPVFHSVNLKFSGYNEPRIFYSPKHSSLLEADHKPDMRSTLYWDPNIKLNSNKDLFIGYFNADNSTVIKIVAEGITNSGIPVTGMTEYEVR